MPLTPEEQKELVRLMNKVTFPAPKEVFEVWCNNFTVTSIEIALIKNKNAGPEIFLTYRSDDFFKGWHIPGSILLPGNTIAEVLQRVEEKEIRGSISQPGFFQWFERAKGNGAGMSARGQETAFVFMAEPSSSIPETATEKFFPFSAIPVDLLKVHVPVIDDIRKQLSRTL